MPGSPTTPSRAGTRDFAPIRVAFRYFDDVGTRDYLAYAAQWLAYALPYRRFAATLAGADARLGADAVRYSFTVVDLHHLLLAGFDRRTEIQADRVETRFPVWSRRYAPQIKVSSGLLSRALGVWLFGEERTAL